MSDRTIQSLPEKNTARVKRVSWLQVYVIIVALLVMLPIVGIFKNALGDSSDVWLHLIQYVLPQSTITTLVLLIGVGVMVAVLGTTTAWFVSRFEFPFRKTLEWALVLPLAIPTYISAYIYVEFLDFTGPVQTLVRSVLDYNSAQDYWFPDVRSTGGAIILLSFVLFPYVYLPVRLSFKMQSSNILDVGRMLGANSLKLFTRVAIPCARPAIVIGIIFVLMETLNDIGAVEYLGVRTVTLSIYDTWLNRSSLAGAAQISLSLLAIILLLIYIERRARYNQNYKDAKSGAANAVRVQLKGPTAFLTALWCLLPVVIGFLIPVSQILLLALQSQNSIFDGPIFSATLNTLFVALFTAIICLVIAFLIVYVALRRQNGTIGWIRNIASFGYAIPGTILALGVLSIFGMIDHSINWLIFSSNTGLIFTGTIIILIYAYSVRFLTIAIGTIEAGYEKISDNLSNASRTLGRSERQTLLQIDLPLLKKAFLTAGVLVCVDTIKELPATLLLRPFNFETLATYVYEHASRAAFDDVAFAALAIIFAGLIPVYILTRLIDTAQK